MAISSKNVIAGVTVSIDGSQLLFDGEAAASWTDDYTPDCKAELSFTPAGGKDSEMVASGDRLSRAGTLTLSVSDEDGKSAETDITLTSESVL